MLSILCLAAALSASPAADAWTVYKPAPVFEAAIRGQAPSYEEMVPPDTGAGGTYVPDGAVPDGAIPYDSGTPQYNGPYAPQPNMGQAPYGGDPWNPSYPLGPEFNPGAMYGAGLYSWGPYGPTAFQNGWNSWYNFGYMPKEPTENGLGQLGIFAFDSEWRYSAPASNQSLYSFTQQFDLRAYDGPLTSGLQSSLPGEVYRIGWDFEYAAPLGGAWSTELSFNPSINSDFKGSLSSDAWNWDGHGILYYRQSPQWTYALGAGFWDRVRDRVVPYAGVIYTPGNRWEFRLVFPEPSVSYYVGSLLGFQEWAYVRGEWNIEAYELQLETTGRRERVEIEDWRLFIGNRKTNGLLTIFLEAGWVFGREVRYAKGTPGFDVSSGFIVQAGLTY